MMKINTILFILIVMFFSTSHKTFSQKRIIKDTVYIADPFVLEHEGTYYLYGTTTSGFGFKYWTSTDLNNWNEQGFAF
jgi:predicted GH43/DUF377 family glycosyl hydrolase